MPHDVFVSYAHQDLECAMEIVDFLESKQVTVWVAPRDIEPASEWAAAIIDAIDTSRLMLLVFSGASNASPHVRREVERAIHRQRPVLPFRIEPVVPVRSMEYFISSQHWMDAFTAPRSRHYARLGQAVAALLGPSPQPQAPATGAPSRTFTSLQLDGLQKALARHVGPIAGYLVRKAAATAADWDSLSGRLAAEIDHPAARREFVESCRNGHR
jgi:hypothetical protein